jgi:hypothetical protein
MVLQYYSAYEYVLLLRTSYSTYTLPNNSWEGNGRTLYGTLESIIPEQDTK